MEASREVFWNIAYGEIIYVLGTIALGVFIFALYRRLRLWRLGRPDDRPRQFWKRVRVFPVSVIDLLLHRKFIGIADGLGHRRFSIKDLKAREFYPGIIHFLIFTGCLVFLLASFLDAVSHYFFHFLRGGFYLGFSVVTDGFGILVLVGVALAMHRRYIQKPERLDNKAEDLVALLLIFSVVASGFVVEGFRIAATELQTNPDWAVWSPGGYILALGMGGFSPAGLLAGHRITWWLHSLLSMGAIVFVSLYWNRLWHIIVSTVNVFFKSLEPKGALVPIDLETAENFGAGKIEDFTWKHLLDLDACTRCGRCQDNCPAYLSGKPLSPKKIIQDLKENWLERAAALPGGKTGATSRAMIGEVITEDEIWNCTTCFACHEACPVSIEPMTKVIEMRRSLVMEQAIVPETGEGALKSIEARGHPWRGTTLSRTDWAEGLDVRTLDGGGDIDVLFWVGCTGALEERSTRVSRAITQVLAKAGVNFGILGAEESCCGDPARRLGNEYLFQMKAAANIELLKNYEVKRIVTGCPHCFHTLKNEYSRFGGDFQVSHHSQFIAELLREGRLGTTPGQGGLVTYHDSCYLGRYNDVYDPPRRILDSLSGVRVVEMEKNLERGFCCGAGGGHLWLEEQKEGRRISEMRVEQAMAVNAGVVATACPYCLQMFEDGIKSKEAEDSLKVMDIAEFLVK